MRRKITSVYTSGFTIIELIIVVLLIGALSGIVLVQYPAMTERARDTQRKNDLAQYRVSLEKFANSNDGLYPSYTDTSEGDEVAATLCGDLSTADCPDDPKGTEPYRYQSNGSGGGTVDATKYVLWAELERSESSINTWVVCSDGRSDESAGTTCGVRCQGFVAGGGSVKFRCYKEDPGASPPCSTENPFGVYNSLVECNTNCTPLVAGSGLPNPAGSEGDCPI